MPAVWACHPARQAHRRAPPGAQPMSILVKKVLLQCRGLGTRRTFREGFRGWRSGGLSLSFQSPNPGTRGDGRLAAAAALRAELRPEIEAGQRQASELAGKSGHGRISPRLRRTGRAKVDGDGCLVSLQEPAINSAGAWKSGIRRCRQQPPPGSDFLLNHWAQSSTISIRVVARRPNACARGVARRVPRWQGGRNTVPLSMRWAFRASFDRVCRSEFRRRSSSAGPSRSTRRALCKETSKNRPLAGHAALGPRIPPVLHLDGEAARRRTSRRKAGSQQACRHCAFVFQGSRRPRQRSSCRWPAWRPGRDAQFGRLARRLPDAGPASVSSRNWSSWRTGSLANYRHQNRRQHRRR